MGEQGLVPYGTPPSVGPNPAAGLDAKRRQLQRQGQGVTPIPPASQGGYSLPPAAPSKTPVPSAPPRGAPGTLPGGQAVPGGLIPQVSDQGGNPNFPPGATQEEVASGLETTARGMGMVAQLAGLPYTVGAGTVSMTLGRLMPWLPKTPLGLLRVIVGGATEEAVNRLLGGDPYIAGGAAVVGGGGALALERGLGGALPTAWRAGVAKAEKYSPQMQARRVAREAAAAARVRQTDEAARAAHRAATGGAKERLAAAESGMGETVRDLTKGRDVAATAQRSLAGARAKAGQAVGEARTAGQARQAAETAHAGAVGEAEQRGQQLVDLIGQAVPPLRGMNVRQFAGAAGLPGTTKLDVVGPWTRAKYAESASLLPPGHKLHIPAMARPNEAWAPGGPALQELDMLRLQAGLGTMPRPGTFAGSLRAPAPTPPYIMQQLVQKYGPQEYTHFTVPEITDRLTELGLQGYAGRNAVSTTRNVVGLPARQERALIKDQTRRAMQQVNPAAWDAFEEGAHAYSTWLAVQHIATQEKVFHRDPNLFLLDTKAWQQAANRYNQRLKDAMTPDEWQAYRHVMYDGGDIATRAQAPDFTFTSKSLATAREAEVRARTAAGTALREARAAGAEARAAQRAVPGLEARAQGMQQTVEQMGRELEAIPPLRLPSETPTPLPWGQSDIIRTYLLAAMEGGATNMARRVMEPGSAEAAARPSLVPNLTSDIRGRLVPGPEPEPMPMTLTYPRGGIEAER